MLTAKMTVPSIHSPASSAVIHVSRRHSCHDLAQVKMGSLPGSWSHFSAREPLHVPLSVMKSRVSRVTEDPRGLAEATDPKERRWDCWRQKRSLVGDQEEIITVNEETVCVERYPSFYSVIMLVNNWKSCCDCSAH